MCYKNSCNSFSDTTTLNKVTSLIPPGIGYPEQISLFCTNIQTTCSNPTSTFPGYWQTWYSGRVTLPSRCNYWTFSVSLFSRSASITNLANPSSHYLYSEATTDNLDAPGDTSPFFSAQSLGYTCANNPFTYNGGAYDVNNDSLDFKLINPMSGAGCPASDSIIAFTTAIPAYNTNNLNGNPLQCNNTFNLNKTTGIISFTPSIAQTGEITMRVDEYRNHIKIGSVMSDMQFVVANCNYGQPVIALSNISNGYLTSASQDTIITAAGADLSFDVTTHGVPITDSVALSSNAATAAPGSLFTNTNSNNGTFSWIPGIGDTAYIHVLTFSSTDNNCAANNVTITNTYNVVVIIRPTPYDSSGCFSGSFGVNLDSSDIGRFIIGTDTFGSVYSHLYNATAFHSYVSVPDTIQLYADSTYIIQESGIMNTIHDADAKVTLFIDYNNNHHYDIPEERVWTAFSKAYYYYILDTSITIPNTVVTDSPIMMRLILNNDTGASIASDDACGPYVSGETQDYTVIFRSATTSVKGIVNIKNISFWPNPSSGKFTIKLNSSSPVTQLQLRVMSVTGQEVYTKTYRGLNRQFSATIDLSAMPKGLYFVETEADGQKQISKVTIE